MDVNKFYTYFKSHVEKKKDSGSNQSFNSANEEETVGGRYATGIGPKKAGAQGRFRNRPQLRSDLQQPTEYSFPAPNDCSNTVETQAAAAVVVEENIVHDGEVEHDYFYGETEPAVEHEAVLIKKDVPGQIMGGTAAEAEVVEEEIARQEVQHEEEVEEEEEEDVSVGRQDGKVGKSGANEGSMVSRLQKRFASPRMQSSRVQFQDWGAPASSRYAPPRQSKYRDYKPSLKRRRRGGSVGGGMRRPRGWDGGFSDEELIEEEEAEAEEMEEILEEDSIATRVQRIEVELAAIKKLLRRGPRKRSQPTVDETAASAEKGLRICPKYIHVEEAVLFSEVHGRNINISDLYPEEGDPKTWMKKVLKELYKVETMERMTCRRMHTTYTLADGQEYERVPDDVWDAIVYVAALKWGPSDDPFEAVRGISAMFQKVGRTFFSDIRWRQKQLRGETDLRRAPQKRRQKELHGW